MSETYRFIGKLGNVLASGTQGFIRPEDVRRRDGGSLGFTLQTSIFVHVEASKLQEGESLDSLQVGAWYSFLIGPGGQPGQLAAERVKPTAAP